MSTESTTDPDLTPKAVLPITHAIVVVKMIEGEPTPMAAVEFREDGHRQVKGNVIPFCTDFLKAASLVSWTAFKSELYTATTTPQP